MSTPAWLSVIAIFFTLFNFLYLLTKDILQRTDNEKKECLLVLKDCFSKILKKDYDGNIAELTSNIEALNYLAIIRLNYISVNRFSLAISDYHEKTISEEQMLGEYKTLLEQIYKADISILEYIKELCKKKTTYHGEHKKIMDLTQNSIKLTSKLRKLQAKLFKKKDD